MAATSTHKNVSDDIYEIIAKQLHSFAVYKTNKTKLQSLLLFTSRDDVRQERGRLDIGYGTPQYK